MLLGVNDILENIASLNKSIKNSQILGNPALELQDQRNDLIDQLASYLPITVKYRDEEVGPGQFVEVLDVHFTASDGSKYTLISDSDFGHLDTGITDGLASCPSLMHPVIRLPEWRICLETEH